MACFGCFGPNRCPGCGGIRQPRRNGRSRGSRAANVLAAGAAADTNGCGSLSPSQELYLGEVADNRVERCCDPLCGCRQYPAAARDPFWPSFAHPRWLSCDYLYSRMNGLNRR